MKRIIEGWNDIWINIIEWHHLIFNKFDDYERWVFFECLNGYPNMEPYKIILSQEDFDALMKVLDAPPKYNDSLSKLLTRPAPWDN